MPPQRGAPTPLFKGKDEFPQKEFSQQENFHFYPPPNILASRHEQQQKMSRRATLRDVALEANVAVSTVSGILNQRADSWASQETRDRVLEAVKKLSYSPNRIARGLRLNRFMHVTLVLPDLTNPFYATLAREFQRALDNRGYELLVEETENDLQKETRVLQDVLAQHTDGVICVLGDPVVHRERLNQLLARMPVVLFGSPMPDTKIDTVASDFRADFGEIIAHLVKLGHSRAGFVDVFAGRSDPISRLQVFRELAAGEKLQFPESSWIRCSPQLDDVRASTRTWAKILPPAERATVLFCTNDLTAICTARGLLDAGLSIPGDVSIVGYDDIPLASLLPCPLTTIAQPVDTMAQRATDALLGRIEGRVTGSATHVSLPTRLILRESTAPTGTSSL